MFSRWFPGLVALIPGLALAQSGESRDAEAVDLQSWSLDELCGAREREDVRDELDRRNLFSRRDLRVIRDGEVRNDISLRTLSCVRGQPDSIVDAAARSPYGPVAAYIYLPGAAQGLIAYVFERSAEPTVVHVLETNDPQEIVRNPDIVLWCMNPTMTRCGLEDTTATRLPFNGLAYPGDNCGARACDADVRRHTYDTRPVSSVAPVPAGAE